LEKTLSDKIILITGGTSRLGSAFVGRALAQGARVFFTFNKSVSQAGALMGEGAEGFPLDLADMRAIDQFVKMLKEKIPALDVLIHNAALVMDHTIQNLSEEEWDLVLTVNLKAPYYLTKKLLPLLFKRTKRYQVPFSTWFQKEPGTF
jgi:NAD(P)-dependent dehydrogenase (short-subunit alcohol dehydrogenase family)